MRGAVGITMIIMMMLMIIKITIIRMSKRIVVFET